MLNLVAPKRASPSRRVRSYARSTCSFKVSTTRWAAPGKWRRPQPRHDSSRLRFCPVAVMTPSQFTFTSPRKAVEMVGGNQPLERDIHHGPKDACLDSHHSRPAILSMNEPASYYDGASFSTRRHIIDSEGRVNAKRAGVLGCNSGATKNFCPF